MKLNLILAAASIALTAVFATAAQAAPILKFQIYDGATLIGSGTDAGSGNLTLAGSDAAFTVSGNATGSPFFTTPDFSTNTFSLSSAGFSGVLTIKVTGVNLTGYLGSNVMSSFALNSLTGGGFTTGTIANYFDSTNADFGTGTLLFSDTYNGKASFSSDKTTAALTSALFSETTIYTLTYAAGAKGTVSASSQLTNVPEPLTLSLFGAGVVGAAALRRRNKKKAA